MSFEQVIPDVCHYCGIHYHPMMVWTKQGSGSPRYACPRNIQEVFAKIDASMLKGVPVGDCESKAIADGYVQRQDLTPKR